MSSTLCGVMYRNMCVAFSMCLGVGTSAYAVAQTASQAVKISDSIYMAPGGGNVYMVTTTDGNVIIDTALADQAPNARKILSAVSQGPVKYIILTHGHADHIGGIPLWKEPGTQIIAQRNYGPAITAQRSRQLYCSMKDMTLPWEERSSNYSARRVKHPTTSRCGSPPTKLRSSAITTTEPDYQSRNPSPPSTR